MTVTDIAIMGVGKIARDAHIPSIEKHPGFRLAATVSSSGGVEGVENFATLDDLLAAREDIPAIALCMPPQSRYEAARTALAAGRHVMLEKPPGATVAEVQALDRLATERNLTLFATWHSRYAQAVEPARAWLARRTARRARITWQEDVRNWHPGQAWIWKAGGVGVFDPGINALSILTEILPVPVRVGAAELEFPENCETPITARLEMKGDGGLSVLANFDWNHEDPPTWDIEVETDDGTLRLSKGGSEMYVDGAPQDVGDTGEYDALYARFSSLLDTGARDVDLSPLVHVADAFMLGRRKIVAPFHE